MLSIGRGLHCLVCCLMNKLRRSTVILWYRLQSERRVLMSDVRLPPNNADATVVGIKEGDDIEVSRITMTL